MKAGFLFVALTVLGLNTTGFSAGLDTYSPDRLTQVQSAPLILAFHSSSCGTCQRQKPALNELLKEDSMSGVTALSIDFDTENELRKKYRVNSASTIVVLKDGKEITRSIGQSSIDDLRKTVSEALAL